MAPSLLLAASLLGCVRAVALPGGEADTCDAEGGLPCGATGASASAGAGDVGSLLQVHKAGDRAGNGCPSCSRVYLMRHCVRGTGMEKDKYQKYSQLPFADWDSPDEWCTGGGFEISKHVGAFLKQRYGLTPGKIKVSNDVLMRKLQTPQAILEGIWEGTGKPEVWSLKTDLPVFHPTDSYPGCDPPDEETQMREAKELIKNTPMPGGLGTPQEVDPAAWNATLQSFKAVIGTGVKDLMTLKPPNYKKDVKWDGKIKLGGSAAALKYFGQQLFYAKASGRGLEDENITFGGWPLHIGIEDIYPLDSWSFYARQLKQGHSLKVTNGVGLVFEILRDLGGRVPPGHAHIYSGSDNEVDALREVFDLTWDVPPFAGSPGPTPPNTGLMFTRYPNGAVDIDVVTAAFTGSLTPPVRAKPVEPSKWTMKGLYDQAKKTIGSVPSAQKCAEIIEAKQPL